MKKNASTFLASIIFTLLVTCIGTPAYAVTWGLSGSSSFTGAISIAMPITDLQVTGGDGITPVPVKLLVTSGTLAMSTTTGLTFTGGTTGSTLYFEGDIDDVNNALATLTYTRGSAGTDTLEVSLVQPGEVFFTGNNHLYKFVSGSYTWDAAKTAAEAQTEYDSAGYLATITSSDENTFISGRLTADGWIGASDAAVEGTWRWATGPESGTAFWSGTSTGSAVDGNYENWATNEPNQAGNEDCAQFYSANAFWNDLSCSNGLGYVVEFGASGDLPNVTATNISITTLALPTVSSFTPADNATAVSTSANLVIGFSQAVTVGTGNITIKKTSDNSTIETIDVTGGQITGGGTSTITINPSSDLAESTGYYVQIPGTAFKNAGNGYYAGIATTTTWNFTTGDFTAPTITNVSSDKTNGSYTVGEVIDIDVTFSEAVTSTGSVTVTLETGTTDRTCTFTVSSATTGTCNYTVQAGDTTSDLTVSSISGTIADASANAMTDFVPATNLAANKAIVVDTTAPVLTVITPLSGNVLYGHTTFYFSTNEECTVLASIPTSTLGTVEFHVDSPIPSATLSAYLSGVQVSGTYSVSFSCTDLAGNESNTLAVGPFSVIGPVAPIPVVVSSYMPSNTSSSSGTSCSISFGTNACASNNTTSQGGTLGKTQNQKFLFMNDLRLRQTHADVKELQKFLNKHGFPVSGSGVGSLGNETTYFGSLTYKAVVAFQEKYAESVLVPINSSKGTGFVGQYTRAELNKQLLVEN